jgi:hypothetical protein
VDLEPSKSGANLPSLSSISTRSKKKTSFLSAVSKLMIYKKKTNRSFTSSESLITPSRTPAPVTSSTPNVADLVLIRHTSTPKPGETASRISIGGKEGVPPLSAIYEVSTPAAARISSPTPSTLTTTDISTAATPMIAVERRSTVRGQAAVARKKIAAMQIRDDQEDEDDDEEQFQKLFSRQRTKKSKDTAVVPKKKPDDLSDVSVSYNFSNIISLIFIY